MGPWRPGVARVLSGGELRTAKRAMTAKYGNKFRVLVITTLFGSPRKHGGRAVGLENSLDEGGTAGVEFGPPDKRGRGRLPDDGRGAAEGRPAP
ncbi:hypothetical protein GCM10022245_06520 [Streptomyces mayteni]